MHKYKHIVKGEPVRLETDAQHNNGDDQEDFDCILSIRRGYSTPHIEGRQIAAQHQICR